MIAKVQNGHGVDKITLSWKVGAVEPTITTLRKLTDISHSTDPIDAGRKVFYVTKPKTKEFTEAVKDAGGSIEDGGRF